jgi:hypothetical protein
MNVIFYQKLDISEHQFLQIARNICHEINEMQNQMKSKLPITKCMNKMLNEGLVTIKSLFLEGEKFEILEKYTPESIF